MSIKMTYDKPDDSIYEPWWVEHGVNCIKVAKCTCTPIRQIPEVKRVYVIDLTVDEDIHNQYVLIAREQGSNASAEIRKHQQSVVEEHNKTHAVKSPIGIIRIDNDKTNYHIPASVINRTLDRWLGDARARIEDKTITEIKNTTAKAIEYKNLVNSACYTIQKSAEQSKEDEIMFQRTRLKQEMDRLQKRNEFLEKQLEEKAITTTTTTRQ